VRIVPLNSVVGLMEELTMVVIGVVVVVVVVTGMGRSRSMNGRRT